MRVSECLTGALLGLLFASLLWAAGLSASVNIPLIFQQAPTDAFPPELIERVNWVRSHVSGMRQPVDTNTVLYLEQPVDAWTFGLYRRAFLPDYNLEAIGSPLEIAGAAKRHHARFVIVFGAVPAEAGLKECIPMPVNPDAITACLGVIDE